eukprot:TRINITY_DN17197_c0_g1_i1.p1 TRINITY_DN17197_c0_g1~~TRINITY_DN17197_c0_g1_i1.p1  ORF type:complete len:113 (-),score=12.05 TRINITY_DN17197_c0_g1_i1:116-454(-)
MFTEQLGRRDSRLVSGASRLRSVTWMQAACHAPPCTSVSEAEARRRPLDLQCCREVRAEEETQVCVCEDGGDAKEAERIPPVELVVHYLNMLDGGLRHGACEACEGAARRTA